MKVIRLKWFLLFLLVGTVFQLPAQQSEANRKLLADIRAKAEKGDAQSQSELGAAFFTGNHGLVKDDVEAVKWFRKGAEQNVAEAQSNLGICYFEGQGVAKDRAEAVKWFRKAAEQNHAFAQYNLGVCYSSGQGVAKDFVEAYKWWLLAAAQGAEPARNDMSTLERRMTPEQIADGKKLASDWLKQHKQPATDSR